MTETEESAEKAWPVETAEQPKRGLPHGLILLGFWGGTFALVLLALFIEPDPRGYGTHERLGMAPCRLMEWTGFPCPGCGITTSATFAVHGDLWRSIVVQPFGLLTVIALPLIAIWALVVHFRGRDLYEQIARRKGRWIRWTLLLMVLAWGYKIVSV